MTFQKASKKESKLRLALFAPSGGGKTFTALRIAKGLGGRVAVIDSEKGSASKYADRFDFDVAELNSPKIENYIKFIHDASDYDVLIIDSLTHGWQELLEEVDKIARAKYRGNTWSAWSEGTPRQRSLVNAILGFKGHIIATMRVKTEWTTEKDQNGRTKPVRVGMAPEQGKGIEYEFDLLMQLSTDHIGHVLKDRTGKFQDQLIEKPGEEFGEALKLWLSSGEEIKKEKSFSKPKDPETKPTPKKRGRPKTQIGEKSDMNQLFPFTSSLHPKLDSLLKENSKNFTDTHFQWIVDQVLSDGSDKTATAMINHVNKVCESIPVEIF